MDDWRYDRAGDLGLPTSKRFGSVQREGGLVSSTTRHLWWAAASVYATVWHRLTVVDRSFLPREGPFVMVANHCSHLDTLAMAAALPMGLREHAFPIAAGDTFFQTTLRRSFSALMLNALPMWRRGCGRHAVETLRRRLTEEGCVFVLFPEGTRSRDGRLGPFKPGLGMLVAGTSVPVVPCHLTGAFEALPPGRTWPRPASITLRIGASQTFPDTDNARSGWDHVAGVVRERVVNLAGAD
ncbi:MAG: 1-acyl-sn-glycerol-3-phosphate acyltransferase [Phycisphaerales bacterium]|nr:1-acyl-sn-glycerol-3-phosphate acyltransferase [Phycisphaerales bacterium]